MTLETSGYLKSVLYLNAKPRFFLNTVCALLRNGCISIEMTIEAPPIHCLLSNNKALFLNICSPVETMQIN